MSVLSVRAGRSRPGGAVDRKTPLPLAVQLVEHVGRLVLQQHLERNITVTPPRCSHRAAPTIPWIRIVDIDWCTDRRDVESIVSRSIPAPMQGI